MENITSLNSPHIERVKALVGPRGKKNRELENSFVAEGVQQSLRHFFLKWARVWQ